MTTKYLLCFLICSGISILSESVVDDKEVRQIATSLDQFAVKFLAKTSQEAGDSLNLALSPYSIWCLLIILREGALENTALELENALGIPFNQSKESFRSIQQELGNFLDRKNDIDVTLDTINTIFTRADKPLRSNYLRIIQDFYNVEISPIDFENTANAVNTINNRISTATRGRITNFVREDDIQAAEVFLASALFFKGSWVSQFNKTATSKEAFYDDLGNQMGEVDMMFNIGPFPFSLVLNNKAIAVELPYKGNISMIVILPKKNVRLQSILTMLSEVPFSSIIEALDKSVEDYGDDPVKIFLPKFSIISDLTLNVILYKMGIKDLFDSDRANLLGMANGKLHVSRILQRAEIQVDEEGTVASSASGASLQFKTAPAIFLADKPFAYFIYDKRSEGIVFAGKVSNPQKI